MGGVCGYITHTLCMMDVTIRWAHPEIIERVMNMRWQMQNDGTIINGECKQTKEMIKSLPKGPRNERTHLFCIIKVNYLDDIELEIAFCTSL